MLPFYAAIRAILNLKRTCPKCKKSQVVKPSRKTETVPCKFCRASIPPPTQIKY